MWSNFSTTADGSASPTERMRRYTGNVCLTTPQIMLRRLPTTLLPVGRVVEDGRKYGAVNGTIQTSDERLKTEITQRLPQTLLNHFALSLISGLRVASGTLGSTTKTTILFTKLLQVLALIGDLLHKRSSSLLTMLVLILADGYLKTRTMPIALSRSGTTSSLHL